MNAAAVQDPIAAIRANARHERTRPLPVRMLLAMGGAWRRRQERRIGAAVRQLGHDGVLEDFRSASRGWR